MFALLMTTEEAEFFAAHMGIGSHYRIINDYAALDRVLEEGPVRLISFCHGLIVPSPVLSRLEGQCFNFHPGPPELPGRRAALRAAEGGSNTYGVTFHTMAEKVDAGPIHAVRRFALPVPSSENEIEVMAYRALLELVTELAPTLADVHARFPRSSEVWLRNRTPT